MLNQFIDYLEEQVNNRSIYVWGGQGEDYNVISEAWIIRMEKTSSNPTTNANRAIAFWKKKVAAGYGKVLRAFDCSGLGMYFIQNLHGLSKIDMTAHSMMGKCKKIIKSELKRGDWAFRVNSSGRATHIGYVVDDKLNVIESKGRDVGVIKGGLNSAGTNYWNAFGRPNYFEAEIISGDGTGTAVWDGNGWKQEGGKWFYFVAGVKQEGWLHVTYKGNYEWFYLDPTTKEMLINWQFINNHWYYLNPANGVMQKGWLYSEGLWFYMAPKKTSAFPEGAMQLGWINDSKADYYMIKDETYGRLGQMATNALIKKADKDMYYLVGKDGKWDNSIYPIIS